MTLGGDNYDHMCLFKPDQEISSEIYNYYIEVGSTVKVSQKYNCSPNAIHHLLRQIDSDYKRFSKVGRGSFLKKTEQEIQNIYEDYKKIGNIETISKKYNLARSTVLNYLRKIDPNYKRFQRNGKFSIEEEKTICEEYNKNPNIKALAKKYNSSWSTIRDVIKKSQS